jgi:hypothetical protein
MQDLSNGLHGCTIFSKIDSPNSQSRRRNKKLPPPQDIKQLQHFLSMVNFYCRFLPKCAQILKPLTDLLKGWAKMLEWTVFAHEAFQNAKLLLAVAVPLQHPAPNAELSLATDASDTHIGRIMQPKSRDHWRPLGFFSCKVTDTESRYSTFDRELLTAHAAIKHFRHFCEGRAFQLWIDPNHWSLCFSSDSEHSRGKTLVFPRLRQYSVHKLSCQMNF